MNLFAIVNVEDFTQFDVFTKAAIGIYATLKLNGEQAANGTWFAMRPAAIPVYSGAVPAAINVNGSCLYVRRDSLLVNKFQGMACSNSHSLCEFV